ncbi:MAG: hypothetical protein HY777_00020 [Betaproteobacteria bacterium]|nr:hypothetical protein [Betaproteobacteria bacterium]
MTYKLFVACLVWGATALALAHTGPVPHRVATTFAHVDAWSTAAVAGIVQSIENDEGSPPAQWPIFLVENALSVRGAVRLAYVGGDGALGASGIAVLFPDIGEPYRAVFNKIIEGIEDKTKARVASFPVGIDADPAEIGAELRKQDIRVVIALGKHGLKAAVSLDPKIEVVAGAVLAVGEAEAKNNTVVSLAPDPTLLFARLKAMQPETRRVTVVYDPAQSDWLIRLARAAAKTHGVELNALAAGDLKAALRQYRDFFAGCGKNDALWLPQDSTTVEDSAVLPLVLKESWDRGIPLFSSSVAHVRRGVLFSLYPNNVELGRLLAHSALGYLGNGSRPAKGMLPLRDVMAAVNTRTASHLGINLRQQSFDLFLPEP